MGPKVKLILALAAFLAIKSRISGKIAQGNIVKDEIEQISYITEKKSLKSAANIFFGIFVHRKTGQNRV